jgi:hypothetical protein
MRFSRFYFSAKMDNLIKNAMSRASSIHLLLLMWKIMKEVIIFGKFFSGLFDLSLDIEKLKPGQ